MAAKTTSRGGDDLTISLITAATYDDVKDEVFALPRAVKAAVAEKEGTSTVGMMCWRYMIASCFI